MTHGTYRANDGYRNTNRIIGLSGTNNGRDTHPVVYYNCTGDLLQRQPRFVRGPFLGSTYLHDNPPSEKDLSFRVEFRSFLTKFSDTILRIQLLKKPICKHRGQIWQFDSRSPTWRQTMTFADVRLFGRTTKYTQFVGNAVKYGNHLELAARCLLCLPLCCTLSCRVALC